MKTKKTLTEILNNQTITDQFTFTGTCPDQNGTPATFTIFNTDFFLNELNHNFFNRVMYVDPDNAFTDLVNTFTIWANNRGYMYARLAYAYSLGYNPIENYNSIEEHSGHDDFDNKKKTTRLYQNDKIERTYTNDKIQRTYSNDKIEREYTHDKIERSYNNDKIERNYDDDQVTRTYTNDKVERAYDNDQLTRTYTNDQVTRTYTNDEIETTHTNDKETTTFNNVQDKHDHDKFGVNSGSAVHVSIDTDTRSGNQTLEKTGSSKETHNGSYDDTHTGSYDDTHTGGYYDEHTGSYDDTHTGGYSDEHSGGYEDDHTGKYSDTHSGGYDDTHSGKYDDTHTGGYYDENSGKDSTIYNSQIAKHGNIGVSTASGMIGELFDGLKQNLALRAVHDFLDNFTFYDGSEVDILW